jgi:hypothetical protein
MPPDLAGDNLVHRLRSKPTRPGDGGRADSGGPVAPNFSNSPVIQLCVVALDPNSNAPEPRAPGHSAVRPCFELVSKSKMIGPDACAGDAFVGVPHDHSRRDFAVGHRPRNTMGQRRPSTLNPEGAVALGVAPGRPHPALAGLGPRAARTVPPALFADVWCAFHT